MGYDLHITRTDFWPESAERPIALEEWRKRIAGDSELRINPDNSHGEELLTAEWLGTGGILLAEEDRPFLIWSDGRITTKYPTSSAIRKMTQIAADLGARVVGDDSEEYLPNGDVMANRFIEEPPGALTRLWAWCRRKTLPERKSARIMVGRWPED